MSLKTVHSCHVAARRQRRSRIYPVRLAVRGFLSGDLERAGPGGNIASCGAAFAVSAFGRSCPRSAVRQRGGLQQPGPKEPTGLLRILAAPSTPLRQYFEITQMVLNERPTAEIGRKRTAFSTWRN